MPICLFFLHSVLFLPVLWSIFWSVIWSVLWFYVRLFSIYPSDFCISVRLYVCLLSIHLFVCFLLDILPEKVSTVRPSPLHCRGLLCPRLGVGVEPVALDLQWAARARKLVAHLLEEPAERGLLGRHQSGSKFVTSIMAAPEKKILSFKILLKIWTAENDVGFC